MKVSFNWISLPALVMNKCIFTWNHTQNTAERRKGEGKQERNYVCFACLCYEKIFYNVGLQSV